MGKKQHQSDKLYITYGEWSNLFGGKRHAVYGSEFKRLPFDCCALSLLPFENPVCTQKGVVFDLVSIVPFIKKYGVDPSTGEKLELKDLIKLHFHKSFQWHSSFLVFVLLLLLFACFRFNFGFLFPGVVTFFLTTV